MRWTAARSASSCRWWKRAEQAKRIVAAAKYPPQGRRSSGGIRSVIDAKAVVPKTNDAIFVAAMIETTVGVENAAAIAAVPGIDMLFIGPFDLSLSIGTFPDFGPEARSGDAVGAAGRARRPARAAACSRRTRRWRRTGGGRASRSAVLTYDQDLLQTPSKAAHPPLLRTRRARDLVEGAVALVTGCNRGIGPETVRALLKAGAKKIYVGARKLDGLKGLIAEAPDKLHPIELDITNKDQIAAAARAAKDVTLLVNNGGINFNTPCSRSRAATTRGARWRSTISARWRCAARSSRS